MLTACSSATCTPPHQGGDALSFDQTLVHSYKSNSQKARVLTEAWAGLHLYCPACGQEHLNHYEANKPVADFFCSGCGADYELKSKRQAAYRLEKRITDGAYASMMQRITSLSNPHLLFMTHDGQRVTSLCFIPKHFFSASCIEPRKPLGPNARRAGWQGCNILLHRIPEAGKIYLIRQNKLLERQKAFELYRQSERMIASNMGCRGWMLDILRCVDDIPSNEFTLSEVYAFEQKLRILHPGNHNIRAKIRQQLQFLRDRGIIEFSSRGQYRKTPTITT